MGIHRFKVWWPDRGHAKDDGRLVEAVDHMHAATIWADWYDGYSADYPIVGGETAVVQVLRADEAAPVTVTVRGWSSREYSADMCPPLTPKVTRRTTRHDFSDIGRRSR